MIAYIKRFYQAAKTKWTTYVAALSTGIALIPKLIGDYWSQAEAAIPHLSVYHATVMMIGLLATVWARVRQELHPPK